MDLSGTSRFEARLRGSVRWITMGACALLLGTMLFGFMVPDAEPWVRWLMIGLPAALLLQSWVWRPTGYLIEGDSLYVLRPVGRKRIGPVRAEARPVEDRLIRAMRLFGNSGLFGVTGWFRNRELGVFRAWVTDTSTLVLLRAEGRVAVISPLDRERFLRKVGADVRPPLSPNPSSARREGRKAVPR